MTPDPILPSWALDASLGIFIHWGPYSVPAWAEPIGAWGAVPEQQWFGHNAYAEWYANTIRIPGSPAATHQRDVYGGRDYGEFLDAWHAEAFDARAWAKLFASAGADYVIPVTKHHDGVALWNAPHSAERNTVDRGPRRDIVGEIADAVRAEGIRFGAYYSGGLDWAYTDFPPIETMGDVERYRPTGTEYSKYATDQVRDLIERYQPSVIWNDIEWPDAGKDDGTLADLMTFYRTEVPEGIVNDRWGAEVGGYPTSEYAYNSDRERGIGWEHNRGLGLSFGYNRLEDESLTLTSRELARLYCDVVSRGGRLLINIGPKASGEIPDIQRKTLEGFGQWVVKVKPLTLDRSPLAEGEIEAVGAGSDDGWFRGWTSRGRTVVVTDGSTAARRADGGDAIHVELPDE